MTIVDALTMPVLRTTSRRFVKTRGLAAVMDDGQILRSRWECCDVSSTEEDRG